MNVKQDMKVSETGKVTDRLWYLGDEKSCIYLLEGAEDAMIVSGGMSHIIPTVLQQMEAFGINEDHIRKLVILHAHFDHIGVVPFFKRRYPQLEIYASSRAWEIIDAPDAIKTINEFARLTNEKLGFADALATFDYCWRDDVSGVSVKEGDIIDLGGMTVQIFETPGHSSCSISAYVPEIRALFPSDGGGIPHKGEIIPAGNSNYTLFQRSLEKLQNLEVNYLCADHGGVVKNREAGEFISQTMQVAEQFRRLVESVYERTGDMEATVRHLVALRYAKDPEYFISEEIVSGVYGQIVRHIAGEIGREKG